MTKKSSKSRAASKTQSARLNPVVIVGVIAVIAIAVIAVIALSGGNTPAATVAQSPASQRILPVAYNAQFSSPGGDHLLIDVRTPQEFADGHIAGAINIPVEEIGGRLNEVPDDKPVVLYCRSGNRSAQAANILVGAGYTGVYDLGGIIDWTAAGYGLVAE